ncbi:hypothetical protein BSKO_07753 [Bryopsis sp. KO-2023]|nr:hypothetical protein BSKO_07753 [Bryopsis sp. KO-2023]
MDWSDSSLSFACERLSVAVEDFTGEATKLIKERALALLNDLRSCRVTLDYLHKVDAVEFISGKKTGPARGEARTESVSKSLDDSTAKQVKDYLVRRIQDYRKKVHKEYEELVPREKEAFEKGFDSFVDICLTEGVSKKRTWFEHQVRSGAGQPHLWKAWVVFQNQLRDACEAKTKEPLPPPLFSTVPDEPEQVDRHFSQHQRGGFGRGQGGAFSDARSKGKNKGYGGQQRSQYRPHHGQNQARGYRNANVNANAYSTGRLRQFCGGRKNGFYDDFQPQQYHNRGNQGQYRYPKSQGGAMYGHGNLGKMMTKRPGQLHQHNTPASKFQYGPADKTLGKENRFKKPQQQSVGKASSEKVNDLKGIQVAIIAPDGKFKTREYTESV